MTTFAFDGSWNQIKGKLRQRYGQLTDDDLNFAEGKGEELLGRLQSKLGLGADQLEDVLNHLKGELAEANDTAKTKAEKFKGMAGQAASDLRAKAEDVVDDLKYAAADRVEQFKDEAGQAYDQARQKARTLQEDSEEYVRQQPRQALFTALAVGFVVGLLFRR